MEPILNDWPLAAMLALLMASVGVLVWLRRQVNRESGDGEGRMARALQSARRAAARVSRDRKPRAWARARMQIAMLLAENGGETHDRARLDEAHSILQATIPVLAAERLSGEWATALYYRGRAEWETGMLETDSAKLETAVATFRQLLALKPWPRHLLRSVVMTLPAVILADIGQRRDDSAAMEEGVALCREAATIARRRIAVEWGITYRNLCHVLTILGRRNGKAALLEEAIAAGREATGAIRQTRYPDQWVASHTCLGHALCTLGDLRGDADRLREGLAVLEEVRRFDGPTAGRTVVAQILGWALLAIGRLTADRVALRRAVQELLGAQKMFTRIGRDFSRAETAQMMGLALASLGAIEKDPAVRQEAESHYRTALEIFTTAGATRQIAETQAALRDLEDGPGRLPPANFIPLYTVR